MRARARIALAAVVAAAVLGGSAGASLPAPHRVGVAPRLPPGAHVVGGLATNTPLKLTIALKPGDPRALAQYATAVATPGASDYHRYLSVAEFRARFAPSDAQIAAVEDSLRAHGLAPGVVSANGLAIPVHSNAGAVGRAFGISFQRATLRSGRTAFFNSQAPLVDPSVAGLVQDVAGLNNVVTPRPLALRRSRAVVPHAVRHVVTGGVQPCSAASSAASTLGAYTADQIASAYGFPGLYGANDFGGGQTVAIYELEGNFPSDITAYESCYGIPTGNVSYTSVDGGPGPPNAANSDGLETELDVEILLSLAPGVNVRVYQGPYFATATDSKIYDTYNAIISANSARVISTSWGLCEQQTGQSFAQAENTLFQEAATQGQTVFAATGDSGSEDCVNSITQTPSPFLAADDPATQPFVTSAGGTRLSGLGPPPTESVWNDNALAGVCANGLGVPVPCGSGGGISEFWSMPTYQSGAPAALHVINANSSGSPCGSSFCREVPDVSANGDPATGYTTYYDGSWSNGTPVGGTSAAGPLWAALIAEINAFSACRGTAIGFANPVLYGTAGHAYAGHFNDVTIGNNDILGLNGGRFSAGPGYDMATGLGTPNAAALATNLCAPAIGVSNPGSQSSRIRKAAKLQILANDGAGYPMSYSATGLPPGLSIGATSGTIAGTPRAAGTYNVIVRATDSRGSFGTTAFRWKVQGTPKLSRGSLTGIASGRPKLAFTLTAGISAPKLKKIAVSPPRGVSFARSTRALKRGTQVRGASFKVRGGKLIITLRHPVTGLRVTITPPALSASRSLVGHRIAMKLHVTDASAFATTLKLKLKPS